MAAMARIVTTQYRYKRPPKKRKPVTLAGPAITTVKSPRGERNKPNPPPPANDDDKPSPKQPAIVTSPEARAIWRGRGYDTGGRPAPGRCRRQAIPRARASSYRQAMKPPPARHWRSYGDDKLPTGPEALDEPFSAFPSWFLRITCDRCGKLQIINEAHAP